MDATTQERLAGQLNRARTSLLDLTRNNSLVHYKPKRSSIKVVGEDPSEVVARLVREAAS